MSAMVLWNSPWQKYELNLEYEELYSTTNTFYQVVDFL